VSLDVVFVANEVTRAVSPDDLGTSLLKIYGQFFNAMFSIEMIAVLH
jgi:hypothetical protein